MRRQSDEKGCAMSNMDKSNGGLLIVGGCAIPADPNSNEPSSVEMLGRSIKGLFAKVRRNRVATTPARAL